MTNCCQARLSFAHDINLGFPADDPAWQKFFAAHNCTPIAYDDFARLMQDLEEAKLTAAFVPAANDYFLHDDATYHGIARALSGKGVAPVDQLPRPVVIARNDAPELFLIGLKTQLLSEPHNPEAFSAGFVDYQAPQSVSNSSLARRLA
jgi:hypothetical protein